MFPIPWFAVLFISIPETVLIIQLGFVLFNLRIEWRETILASVFMGIVAYILLRLPIIPGAHTLMLIFITTLIISWLSKVKVWYSLIAVLCGAMIVGVIENVIVPLALILMSKTISDLSTHPWLNIGVSLPTTLLAALLFFLVRRFRLVLYDLNMKGSPK
ncbi:MAG: hypothetical protein CVU90_08205 [Firmicutes bacterium HGW-Firmicutes-15]|nr:MAG: hypothetical protein CVU90_08205 [Firmicutes bacterium HGW-Firmicutes-15]